MALKRLGKQLRSTGIVMRVPIKMSMAEIVIHHSNNA